MSSDLSPTENFALGFIAASIEGVLLQPTLYWKNARAQNLAFTLNPRLLYRGTSASIFNECQMMGFQFGFTSALQKSLFSNRSGEPSADGESGDNCATMTKSAEFASAACGGILAALLASPVELVMITQQKEGGSVFQACRKIVGRYGVFNGRGLMRGLSATATRDCIYVFGMLGVTPAVQTYLEGAAGQNAGGESEWWRGQTHGTASLVASIVGGVIAAIPSHPFDVIKTCMQGDLAQEKYASVRQTIQTLCREGREEGHRSRAVLLKTTSDLSAVAHSIHGQAVEVLSTSNDASSEFIGSKTRSDRPPVSRACGSSPDTSISSSCSADVEFPRQKPHKTSASIGRLPFSGGAGGAGGVDCAVGDNRCGVSKNSGITSQARRPLGASSGGSGGGVELEAIFGVLRRFFRGGMWRTINIVATVYIANECKTRLSPLLH